jgi:hypothetical protein
MNSPTRRAARGILLASSLALVMAGAVSAAPSQAASSQPTAPSGATLTAQPSVITTTIKPGGKDTSTLTLRAGQDLDIAIEPQGLGQSPADGGFVFVAAAADTSPYSARSFITVTPAAFQMKAGETKTVSVAVTLPSGKAEGERYAIVKVNGHPAGSAGNVGIGVALGVSVLVNMPNATTTLSGKIGDLAANGLIGGSPLTVTGTIDNTGDAHFGAAPSMLYQAATLRDASGAALATTRKTMSGNSIVPTYGRAFSLTLDPGYTVPPGKYTVDVEVGLQDGPVLDRATTEVGTPSGAVAGVTGTPSAGDTQSAPVLLLGAGLAVLLIGVLVVGRRMRRRRPAAS